MQHVSKIVVGITDIARLKEQYAKIKRQVTFIETLLIRDDLGKIARHFRERHGSLAVRRRRMTLSLIAEFMAYIQCYGRTDDRIPHTPAC